jgi:hypothetical protein
MFAKVLLMIYKKTQNEFDNLCRKWSDVLAENLELNRPLRVPDLKVSLVILAQLLYDLLYRTYQLLPVVD